ncbi:MAG: hypothetical protein DRR19_30275 [Candidatus Parabeggiatoa sp. nov. 1]|nr:MAG: hypothetical protein DRR19_30275 [Gammaproteobacteria bacterium]
MGNAVASPTNKSHVDCFASCPVRLFGCLDHILILPQKLIYFLILTDFAKRFANQKILNKSIS